jgi:hypothetical protein
MIDNGSDGKSGRYFAVLGEGSLLAAAVYLGVGGLAAAFHTRPPDVMAPLAEQVIAVIVFMTLPVGPSAYWIFRRLRCHGTRRNASLVARTFAVVAPIGLGIGAPLAWGVGAAVDAVLIAKQPWVRLVGLEIGMAGAIAGTVAVATGTATAVAMRIARQSDALPSVRDDVGRSN